ncbi:hypothetical protein [Paenibacillus borealis]|uniref:Tat pathway signal sequence domain protein n=1 Tax=Paenibacillus borealis TaxID=160799 RepID=A0A089LD00_PAEBO|nr:hypothetical protein [Paenibacillus borealis]AIQ57018.1 hypothetical protein PBOR_08810 [Paenibacillus borealis]
MSKLQLHWLTARQAEQAPVSFGTPWSQGALLPGEAVSLQDEAGTGVPVQTRINAYWPDGSVKWLLHSGVLDTRQAYCVSKGESAEPTAAATISASQSPDGSVTVESGLLSCRIEKGSLLISSLRRKQTDHKPVSAQLTALIENRDEQEGIETISIHKLNGVTEKITLEEAGPLRAVVKLEGIHEYMNREVSRFPFVIRLYFYAGSDEVRMVHSFAFDADENTDYLKGLAVQFNMEATGELWNRHVGFTGDTGMFYEAVQPMYTYSGAAHPVYEQQQICGQFVPVHLVEEAGLLENVRDNAAWGNFRLQQDSCDHYSILKSTNRQCAYIPAAQGNRSLGAAFFGSESVILGAAVKDFWQKSPMALEVTDAAGEQPALTVWLWSRYAEAFDFRAYDTASHTFSYGDIDNHPEGIANTNEITLKLFGQMPGKQAILDFAGDVQTDSLLIADPQVYEETKVFGTYWLPPKLEQYTAPEHERALLGFMDFYIQEVEQRKWYGFWDYGDVMHTYDHVRHTWRYDVGGFAWQNTELCNTYVNWLLFLRTGDYDIFRFARAMTRHTSEVDMYHLGAYAMLGSRHNVRHWGCRWKEPRISMAGHHRFFYYLTGDERTGDIMDSVKDADYAKPRDQVVTAEGYTSVRTGPDWSSYVSNWMVQWERYQDTKYRDKILTGIASLKQAPNRLSSGSHFHYNPETGELHYLSEGNYQYHMVICFGGPEIWFELAEWIHDEEFKDMLAQFGDYFAMTPEERNLKSGGLFNDSNDQAWDGLRFAIRMPAYTGYRHQNPARMQQALNMLRSEADISSNTPGQTDDEGNLIYTNVPKTEYIREIREVPFVNTNGISQWSLNYMETAKLLEQMNEEGDPSDDNNRR